VIVHYLNLVRISISKLEADTELIVDPDAVLVRPIANQRLQPIARRHSQGLKTPRCIKHEQLSPCHALDLPKRLR
jgi:hypothetical protein